MTTATSSVLGRPLWFELMTTDMKAAEKFYKTVVGWTSAPFEGSPQPYTMFKRGGDVPVRGLDEEARWDELPAVLGDVRRRDEARRRGRPHQEARAARNGRPSSTFRPSAACR